MQRLLLRWLILVLAVFIAAHLEFMGIHYDRFSALLVASLVIGLLNAFVKPLLMVISMPFILLTFGLLILLINASIFYVSGLVVEGFEVDSFGSAIGGAVVVSLVSYLLGTDSKTVIVHRTYSRNGPPGRGPIIDL